MMIVTAAASNALPYVTAMRRPSSCPLKRLRSITTSGVNDSTYASDMHRPTIVAQSVAGNTLVPMKMSTSCSAYMSAMNMNGERPSSNA